MVACALADCALHEGVEVKTDLYPTLQCRPPCSIGPGRCGSIAMNVKLAPNVGIASELGQADRRLCRLRKWFALRVENELR